MPIIVPHFSDLPVIGSRAHPWGRSVVPLVRRIRAWMTNGTRKPEDIELERARRIHMAYEPDRAQEWGGWHLPYADIVGGQPAAVFKAIAAIIRLLNGARGGLAHMLSAEQQALAWGQCARYYEKWEQPMPERSVRKTATITFDVEAVKTMPDIALLAEMLRQLRGQGEIEKADAEQPLLTVDLTNNTEMSDHIEALEGKLQEAEEMLAAARERGQKHGIESYRADIQYWTAEVQRLQAELGIEQEDEEGSNKTALMCGLTPPSSSPPR